MDSSTTQKRGAGRKLFIAAIVGLSVVIAYDQYGDYLSISRLAAHEAALKQFQSKHAYLVLGIAFLMYVAATAFSLPVALPMSVAFGWFFGFWRALLLVSFASTIGATLAFLLSRYLFADAIQNRFGNHLSGFNEALRREGAFYLFTLRLIPAVPFFVINVVMGLTPIRVRTFSWVSQIGMLPGTCVFVYAGTPLPSLEQLAQYGARDIVSWQIAVAFVLLGVFPLATKKLIERFRPTRPETETTQSTD